MMIDPAPAPPGIPATHSARRPLVLGFLAMTLLFGGFATWLTTARIAGGLVLQGHLAAASAPIPIHASEIGRISELHVKQGDIVRAGDTLARIRVSGLDREIDAVVATLRQKQARRARLIAERDRRDRIDRRGLAQSAALDEEDEILADRRQSTRVETARLTALWDQARARIGGHVARQTALKRQLGTLVRELERTDDLFARGLVPRERVVSLRLEHAKLLGDIAGTAAAIDEQEARQRELEQSIRLRGNRVPEEARIELREVESELATLTARQRILFGQVANHVIAAPVSGEVHDLRIPGAGVLVRPGEPLMWIVRNDGDFVVTAMVGARQVGAMSPGQRLRLSSPNADGLGQTSFPGTITLISPQPVQVQRESEGAYRVTILPELTDETRKRLTTLRTGMPVEIQLATPRQTLLEYLMEPLARTLRNGLARG